MRRLLYMYWLTCKSLSPTTILSPAMRVLLRERTILLVEFCMLPATCICWNRATWFSRIWSTFGKAGHYQRLGGGHYLHSFWIWSYPSPFPLRVNSDGEGYDNSDLIWTGGNASVHLFWGNYSMMDEGWQIQCGHRNTALIRIKNYVQITVCRQ